MFGLLLLFFMNQPVPRGPLDRMPAWWKTTTTN